MLARSAAGLYWMGRFLERASHLARLLRQQTESLVDSPVRTIYFGWHRIYGALGRRPHQGVLEIETQDLFALADSYTLADDLTFEPTNPDSIRSCVAAGRENARQMRHCISAEMWTTLNRSYLRLQSVEIKDIWLTSPELFYAETVTEIDTFRGVTSSTMYRDEGWYFVRLGSALERALLCASLLRAQIAAVELFEVPADAYWTSLLRHYHAFEAYDRGAGTAISPDRVLDLLVSSPRIPDSLVASVSRVRRDLAAVSADVDSTATATARRRADRIYDLVRSEWPVAEDRSGVLERIAGACRHLHDQVTETFFGFPIAMPTAAGAADQ